MHAEPTGTPTSDPVADAIEHAERTLLALLLSKTHALWTCSELEREVAGLHGERLDVADAIDGLFAAGVVHVTRHLVTLTRAAARVSELIG